MDDWEQFNKTSLPEKEEFYSHLNMEDITDADYVRAKGVYKELKTKNLKRISIFVCSRQYIIVGWCIWELSKYVSQNKRTWCCKNYFSPQISMGAALKKT